MILPSLFIAPAGKKGRGVYTSEAIAANTIIEISPVLVLSKDERAIAENTGLYNYVFEWGDNRKKGALGLGYISMYNHSYAANCDYEMDYDHEIMKIVTVKSVAAGEELLINYNASPNDETPVWFHL